MGQLTAHASTIIECTLIGTWNSHPLAANGMLGSTKGSEPVATMAVL